MNRRVTRNTLIMVVLMSMTTILLLGLIQPSAPGPKAYSEFQADVKAGNVITISRTLDTLTVTDTGGTQYTVIDDAPAAGDWAVIESWAPPNLKTLKYTNAPAADLGWVFSLLALLLPAALVLFFIFFFMRQLQGTNNQAMSFGKSKARMFIANKTVVTFADVAGADEAKVDLEEIVEFLKYPEKFNGLGARIPRGVLLVGPPGCGKTLMARAVAGQAGVPFFSISGSEFVEMFVGVGASVTGDTPVLMRTEKGTELVSIAEFVDRYYQDSRSDRVIAVQGVETLGYEPRVTGFRGHLNSFEGSAWKSVSGVLRHRVKEIYEIEYLGGKLRTTGDHSVFVRGHGGIKTKMTQDLVPGDVLVALPSKVRNAWDTANKQTTHRVRAHSFDNTQAEYLTVIPRNEQVENSFAFALDNKGVMSQSTIAAQIGVSQSTVGLWQNGVHFPRQITSKLTDVVLPEKVAITPDLMRLFGYYTAEGHATGSVIFTFGTHETDLIADCVALGEEIFGVKAALRPTLDNSTNVIFYSSALGRLFAAQCGNGSRNKHIPEMLWSLPREHFLAYLEGYTRGDGYVDPKGRTIATSVSHQLIRELAWICAMHGIKTGSRQVVSPGGRIIKGKTKPLPETIAWSLIIGATSATQSQPDAQGTPKRSIVRKVSRVPYEGYVYDLVGCENEAFFGGESPLLLHNSRMRDIFDQAKRNSPSIIFVDEIDAVGRQRGTGLGGSHDEREQTLNQMLVEMDGFDTSTNVIVIAATNRPDVLDPALLRPGRFDRQVILDRPDLRGRVAILKVHSKGKPLDAAINLENLARQSAGMSGADLANLVNEAAILAARRGRKVIDMADFGQALDKIIAGPERRSRVISDAEKRIIAIHEGGHAVVQRILPKCDPVHKVTIIGRGMALGYTMALPTEDRYLSSKTEFEDKIAGLLAGNAAENLIFGDITTGAANDIEKATNLARRMVTEWGMSERMGPLSFGKRDEMIFLGREIGEQRNYSDDVAKMIDEEVHAIIDRGYARASEVLIQYKFKLMALADKLIAEETVESEEFEKLFADLPPKLETQPMPLEGTPLAQDTMATPLS